jgi:hypothetical protein
VANNTFVDDDGEEAKVSKSAIGLFFLLVYVALVTILGGTVYVVYVWRSHPGVCNGNVIAAVKEMAKIASINSSTCDAVFFYSCYIKQGAKIPQCLMSSITDRIAIVF